MNQLDITDWQQRGESLKVAIVLAVKETQNFINYPLPDELKMTKAQYNALNKDPEMIDAFSSGDRLYMTPLNIMEIKVKL